MTTRPRASFQFAALILGLFGVVLFACAVTRTDDAPPPSAPRSAAAPAGGARAFVPRDDGFVREGAGLWLAVNPAGRLALRPSGGSAASFVLETVAIGRTRGPDAASGRARLEGDGAVAVARGGTLERFLARPSGVEQRWEIGAKPQGEGDFVVRVRASGGKPVNDGDHDLVFADATQTVFLRYGQATWVDGAGVRTSVPARLEGQDIVLTVPAPLVEQSAYPAVLDPIVGLEFELEAPQFIPSHDVGTPNIASDGKSTYLVVWQTASEVFAARVGANGQVLQPGRTLVATASTYDTFNGQAKAVWDGTEWLVAWSYKATFNTVTRSYLDYARVAADGTLLDATERYFSVTADSAFDLASDGTNVFLVWTNQDGSIGNQAPHVYGTLIGPGGVVGTTVTISDVGYEQTGPRVVFDGIEYLVAWDDARATTNSSYPAWDIYAARVTTAGALVDTSGIPISTAPGSQSLGGLATSGTNVLLGWIDERSGSPQAYVARFASATGLVDGPAATGGIFVANTSPYSDLSLAFDGTDYVATWAAPVALDAGATEDIVAARVSTAGVVLGASGKPTVTVSGSGVAYAALGGTKAGALAVWLDGSGYIRGERIDPSGALLDGPPPSGGFVVSQEPSAKTMPAAASNGTNYLVAWCDNRENSGAGCGAIYATRTGAAPLDVPAFPVVSGRASITGVSVASNGTDYAVVWNESGKIFARVIDANGKLVDGPAAAAGLLLTATALPASAPAVASDGKDFLAVWIDTRGATQALPVQNVQAARFSSAPSVYPVSGSSDGSFVVEASQYATAPAAIFDGTNYLVAWSATYLFTERLTPLGQQIDRLGSVVGPTAPAALAWNGANYLIASKTGYPSSQVTTNVDIVGAPLKVVASGQVPNTPSVNSAVFDGASFWVFAGGYGIRVRGDATIVDSTLVAPAAGDQSFMASAADGHDDGLLVVYPVGTDARARILVDDAPNGKPCTLDSCASGVCEDGVCCDRPCGGSAGDCQACSVAAGATKDGVCSIASAGFVCRPGSACELAGKCDGVTTACPADYFLPPNTVCGDAGECTFAPLCSGTTAACTPPQSRSNGTPCGDGGTCGGGLCIEPVHDAGVDAAQPDAGSDAGASGGGDSGAIADASVPPDAGAEDGAADATPDMDASNEALDASADARAVTGAADAAEDGSGAGSPSAATSSGCGCRTAGNRDTGGWAVLLVAGPIAMLRRRKRRGGAGAHRQVG